jgi:3-phosphoshikimate 1-carboxyvinyltransferase
VLAGQRFNSTITGDASLLKRPMLRVIEPLRAMGAKVEGSSQNTPPLNIHTVGSLSPIRYNMPLPSAQVKSAILLAGLYAEGTTAIIETHTTRDHTERMLGLTVQVVDGKRTIEVQGGMSIDPRHYFIPGDLSAAAFLIAAGSIIPQSEIVLRDVGLNPTRIALLEVVRKMGCLLTIENQRVMHREPMGDLRIRSSMLKTNIELRGSLIPPLIDEFPILAVLAAFAQGTLIVRDAGDLRNKESDRIALIVQNLRAMGVATEEYDDGFAIEGTAKLHAAEIQTKQDHRIAMAFAVAGLALKGETAIHDAECTDISYPYFWETLEAIRSSSSVKAE